MSLLAPIIGGATGLIGGILGMSAQSQAAKQQARQYAQYMSLMKRMLAMQEREADAWRPTRDVALSNISKVQTGNYGGVPLYQQAMKGLSDGINKSQTAIKRNMALTGNERSGNFYKQNEQEMRNAGMNNINSLMASLSQNADSTALSGYNNAYGALPGMMQQVGMGYAGAPNSAGMTANGLMQMVNSLGNAGYSYFANQDAWNRLAGLVKNMDTRYDAPSAPAIP